MQVSTLTCKCSTALRGPGESYSDVILPDGEGSGRVNEPAVCPRRSEEVRRRDGRYALRPSFAD
jgi:hypothetical protein